MDRQHDNDQFYHSQQWQRMRQRILRRDAYMCQNCKRYGKLIEAVEEEVNGFKGFEKREIQRYLDKVYDEIGVRFEYK